MEIFGIPSQALFGQLLIGLINGSFYAMLSLGLAVIFGLLNIINFTHGTQYMLGAFAAYLGLTHLGLSYWASLLLAPLITGATGMLAIRRQGIYFAMITLALAQLVYFLCLQAPFTGGEDGIQGVPRGKLFGLIDLKSTTAMYLTVMAIFLGGFGLIWRIVSSPFGEVLKAIRENEPRALSLGYDTSFFKLIALILSGTLAGLAGATKALVFQLASLTDVHWSMSGEVVLMTLIGGLGTLFGPVLGAAVIVSMQNYLADLGSWVTVAQGVIFVVCVMAFRKGVIGELASWLKRPL